MSEFIFYVFAATMLLSGLMMVCSRNAVNGAMYMILSLVCMSGLFILLQAYLLAALQVLVYAGAIVVLFLFIIMLLDVDKAASSGRTFFKRQFIFPTVIFLILVAMLVNLTLMRPAQLDVYPSLSLGSSSHLPVTEPLQASAASDSANFGRVLFSQYVLPVQVTGFMLLTAMIGVIHMSKRRKPADDESAASEPLPEKPAPAANA